MADDMRYRFKGSMRGALGAPVKFASLDFCEVFNRVNKVHGAWLKVDGKWGRGRLKVSAS